MFDWYYQREPASGRSVLVWIEPKATSASQEGHRRIFGENLNRVDDTELIFRSVRGNATCADLALGRQAAFPMTQLKSFLVDVKDRPADQRLPITPSTSWESFVESVDAGEFSDEFSALEAVKALFDVHPDRRIGTASLVPSAGHGIDVLITSTTDERGAEGRVVGELLEIACLNALYKPSEEDYVASAISLLDLVTDPDDVRRTWIGHLARTLEFNPIHWKAQVAAIDLAESKLVKFWGEVATDLGQEDPIRGTNIAEGV